VTVVLDAGAISALATDRARVRALLDRGLWPPQVPAPVLTESLTGDHRRDILANRLLRLCQVREVDEPLARTAARLRFRTGRAATISAVDALVVALALARDAVIIVTGDVRDVADLVDASGAPIAIAPA